MRRRSAILLAIGLGAAGWLAFDAGSSAACATDFTVATVEGDPLRQTGFAIIQEAYRRIGVAARSVYLPNERGLRAAALGEVDADTMRVAGTEQRYTDLVPVPEMLLTFDGLVFTTGLTFKVDGWDSLRPYSICVLRGFKVAEQATQGMQVTFGESTAGVIQMLHAGRCQVTVLDAPVWLEIDRLKAGPMLTLTPPVVSLPLYHYVHRSHADLAPKLAAALRDMRADGTTERLLAADEAPIEAARRRNLAVGY